MHVKFAILPFRINTLIEKIEQEKYSIRNELLINNCNWSIVGRLGVINQRR